MQRRRVGERHRRGHGRKRNTLDTGHGHLGDAQRPSEQGVRTKNFRNRRVHRKGNDWLRGIYCFRTYCAICSIGNRRDSFACLIVVDVFTPVRTAANLYAETPVFLL